MRRTDFLRFLGAIRLLPSFTTSALLAQDVVEQKSTALANHETEKLLYGGYLRGLPYYDYREVYPLLKKGTAMDLLRDPENGHDSYAIEVWFGGYKLGFLPRAENKTLSHILYHGYPLCCEIRYDPSEKKFTDLTFCR